MPYECQAIKERKEVTVAIARCLATLNPADTDYHMTEMLQPIMERKEFGTEKGMVVLFSILHGIVNEYLDGGDQMVENCSCGKHTGLELSDGSQRH